ncbi:MAG: hypothetical protein JW785_02980 [Acidimicrobiia bacterium]|nr:hypothetical protein [Acidimicrobiia bacterium]
MTLDPFPLALMAAHARRYPRWEAVDLYKLLHQGTRGSEHAAPSEEAAGEALERELGKMGPGPAEPLVDPIRADGAIARVHLRAWLAAGFDPHLLLAAFLETAANWEEVPGELEEALRRLGARAGELGLPPGEVTKLAGRMKAQGYPAAHHSEGYRILYRPAYRVVAARFLPPELVSGGGR